jgi:hypothetical protein
VYLDPWTAVHTEQATRLEEELRREVAEGHVLHGRPARAIARRVDRDDVLFELQDDHACAVVHLTWCQGVERPPWPSTHIFESLSAWMNKAMHDDHRDYMGEE